MSHAAKALLGRTAIVTGASSGNGRSMALALARAGANVVCSDVSPAPRSSGFEANMDLPTHELIASKVLRGSGGGGNGAAFQQCDVAKPHEVRDLVSAAAARFGRVDVMINNAGICAPLRDIVDEAEDDYRRTMAINVDGVYFGCKYAIKQFLAQEPLPPSSSSSSSLAGLAADQEEEPDNVALGQLPADQTFPLGKIINISSIGGMVGLRGEPAYCTSKGAVLNLTRQLALDFGNRRINVNAICPGFVATAMAKGMIEDEAYGKVLRDSHSLPRLGRARDISGAALWLSGTDSDWVTGAAIPVDGGYTAR